MADIIAIGASQGGVQALRTIARALPADFPLPILVVLHVGAEQSVLPAILTECGPLTASHAEQGERLRGGHIYVAPPDRHLLAVDGKIELTHGPRENWVRPAIDPLFRSIAEVFGPAAVGVVLTGRLNDGTSGLFEIKRRGGIAVVQDPKTAEAPDMPQSALQNVQVDFCLPTKDIAEQLVRLAKEKTTRTSQPVGATAMNDKDLPDRPIAQTCPECGGAMSEETLGTLTRFRCHIGHVMTAEVLASVQLDNLGQGFEAVLRLLNERAELCRLMAEKHLANGNEAAGNLWKRAAEEAVKREPSAKNFTEYDWTHPEQPVAAEKKG